MKPSKRLFFTEIPRAVVELIKFAATTYPEEAHEGHPILFIPGFGASDFTTKLARNFFENRGYETYGWNQGTNLGPTEKALDGLTKLFLDLSDLHGEPITIVGHSLGGIYARQLAKAYTDRVRSVITLGTPISEPEGATHMEDLFRYINPNAEDILLDLPVAPPVPTTIIYTEEDGIVHYKACVQIDPPAHVRNICVSGSHTGLIINTEVYDIMLDSLAGC